MVRQLRLACRFAAYLAALITLGMPNNLLARDCRCTKTGLGWMMGDECPVDAIPDECPLDAISVVRARLKLLETGFSLLKDIGGEESGYGLYSYAIVVNDDDRSQIFLRGLFRTIPTVEDTAAQKRQTNVFYIPTKNVVFYNTKNAKVPELSEATNFQIEYEKFFISYAKDLYDYKIARSLLDHLCDPPAKEIRAVCEGDLSRGPYIFSYAQPASKLAPVPPPFLFMDLSDVHERAFPEIIAAFKAQVKRDDISDRAKMDTLRLKLLSIALTAADWLVPVHKAVADIVHGTSGQSEKDKK